MKPTAALPEVKTMFNSLPSVLVKRILSVQTFSILTFAVFNGALACRDVINASNVTALGENAVPSTVNAAVILDVLVTAPEVITVYVAPVCLLNSQKPNPSAAVLYLT